MNKANTRSKDWSNQKFFRITLVKRSDEKNSNGAFKWEGVCDCGKNVLVVPGHIASGMVKSCGCYNSEQKSQMARKLGEDSRRYDPVISSARAIWQNGGIYKDGGLTFEEFYELSQKNCYYCSAPPSNKFNRLDRRTSKNQIENGLFVYNGLDRVDNNKKHTKENVVPCCKNCNVAKSNLSQSEFFESLMKIYVKHNLNLF